MTDSDAEVVATVPVIDGEGVELLGDNLQTGAQAQEDASKTEA